MKFNNLVELLFERARNSHEQIFFLTPSGAAKGFTYRQILDGATKVSSYLLQQGLTSGSTVGIVLPTSPEFIFSFFGIQMAGGIPVALYPPLRIGLLKEWKKNTQQQLTQVETKAVITNNAIYDILGEPIMGAGVPLGAIKIESLEQSQHLSNYNNIAIHDVAFMQFTSGTTGFSKPVMITHSNVLHNTDAILDAFHLKRTEIRCVSWLPLYHDMGLVGAFLGAVVADCILYLIRPEKFIGHPFLWLKAISDHKINVTVAPNFAYGLCTRRISEDQIKELDLSSLEVALCGAEMIHPQTLENFIDKFKGCGLNETVLTPVYGLAESALAVTFCDTKAKIHWQNFEQSSVQTGARVKARSDGIGVRLASVGRPIKATQVKICGDSGEDLPLGYVGIIWVNSPSVMKGYFQLPKDTGEALVNGWLKTGDIGFFHEEELFICGRKKEIMIIRGQNYDPTWVERSLLDVSEIREGCAVAFSSYSESKDSEALFMAAELKQDIVLSNEEMSTLKERIRGIISEEHSLNLEDITFLPSGILPRTSSGKIKRRLIKELWEGGNLKISSSKKSWLYPYISILIGKIAHVINRVKN